MKTWIASSADSPLSLCYSGTGAMTGGGRVSPIVIQVYACVLQAFHIRLLEDDSMSL
ncbi:MAG: hypothetical protein UV60_C0043G0002 [Parcubacteria group bacterium GW2011_GWA2_43_11]|nr:MAG: hypothetical protein UV60_C0043G0002 [Parcubacteria group bacterium GW2011_GWA2_43_11]